MNNIGKKIKELRKMNDLTQEKLADFLGVTYQSVSKWECGTTMPDLSLIPPLTRLLNVSADELLGLTAPETDERRAELEENLRQAWRNGGELDGFALVYEAEEALVREYPGDMKLLCDFAWTVSNRAFHYGDFQTETEKAIRYFDTVIENTEDDKLMVFAIEGITNALSYLDRCEEAKKYVELLPDEPLRTKNQLLATCLRGEELRKHHQKLLENALHTLISCMTDCNTNKLQAITDAEEILHTFFPDNNCLEFHCNLLELAQEKALIHMRENRHDEAVRALEEYKMHSILADKADVHTEELCYTSPYFDLLTLPPFMPEESCMPGWTEAFARRLTDDCFAPLRDRDDFKALFKSE